MDDEFCIFSFLQILKEQEISRGKSPKLADVTKTSDELAHLQIHESAVNQEVQENIQEDSNLVAEINNVQDPNQSYNVSAAPSTGEIHEHLS